MGSFFLSDLDYRSIKYSSIIFTRCILPKQNLKVDNEAQNYTVYRKNLFYLLKLTVQFAEAKLYSLPKQNCTVYRSKTVQFTEAKLYSLPLQNCTVYRSKLYSLPKHKTVQFTKNLYSLPKQNSTVYRSKTVQFTEA